MEDMAQNPECDEQARLTPRFTCWGQAGYRELGNLRQDHTGPVLSTTTRRLREVLQLTSHHPVRTATGFVDTSITPSFLVRVFYSLLKKNFLVCDRNVSVFKA